MSSHNAQLHRPRKPNARRPTITRSKSFIGTIKNFLPAPLAAWLGSTDDFTTEDTKGKRRNLAPSNAGDNLAEDGSSRTKRIRVSSPDRLVKSGYLDPPGQIFQQSVTEQSQQQRPNYPSNLPNRSSSVTIPSTTLQQLPRNRHTVSPFRSNSFSRPEGISRTMSMDPPHQRSVTRDTTMMSIHRESSREDISPSRDMSITSVRAPFRMRTSLTPHASGSGFGPTAPHRDLSEPPPLTSLMSRPIFVKAPPEQGAMSAQQPSTTTLGSLVDSQRNTRSPVRQHSAILFGSQSGSMSNVSSFRPTNAAEKALHELDVYKTPLLPTRLRGSSALPDMFKPKMSRKLILMHEKDEPDHLGISGKKKGKGKEEVNGTKPYAGEGGMKKLLARRKKEAEEEMKKEKSEAMEEEVEEQKDYVPSNREKSRSPDHSWARDPIPQIVPVPPATDSPFNVAGERVQSSLRVGRTKTSRNHISRPVSRAKNRFSALYDEDDGDDQMMDQGMSKDQAMLEEVAQNIPVFNIPSGFSFPTEITPVHHDLTKAKEPPMTALPFSFTNTGNANTSAASSQSSVPPSEQQPKLLPSVFRPPSITPSTSAFSNISLAPSISLTPPTPVAVKEVTSTQSMVIPTIAVAAPVPSIGSPVPNFFSNSSVLSKPTISIVTPSSTPPAPVMDADNPFWEGGKEKDQTQGVPSSESLSEQKSSLLERSEKPVDATLLFGAPTNDENAASALDSRASSSVFAESTPLAPSEGGGSTRSTSVFTAPPITTESTQSFSFGAPKPTELSMTNSPTLNSGVNNVEPPVTKTAPEIPKPSSAFRAPSATSFGGLEGSGSTIATSPFGQPGPVSSTATTSFLFSQPSSTAQAADTAKSPFSFNAAPTTTPTAEKKPSFGFSAPVAAPTGSGFSFGAPSGSSANDVSSKPFSFGLATPARPVTPKNDEQEFRMEESPTRDMQLNGKQAEAESRPSLSFQFGSSSTGSSFSQPSQTTSTPFPFSTIASNPFTKAENKAEEKLPVSFSGFGQTQPPSAGFSFGQKTLAPEPARPSTTSSFAFQPASSASGSSFAFGAPVANNSNPFNQPTTQSISTPSSPSTFSQPPQFSFAQPAAAPSTSFTFGASQPASPAVGNSNLPQPTPSGFSFTHSGGSTPTSPFSATAPAPPAGGTLFTIGAPPAPSPGGAGRQFKKLPNRRGAKR